MKCRKPAAAASVKYVRAGAPTVKFRLERQKWKRNLADFFMKSDLEMEKMLMEDRFLFDQEGRKCPYCGKGRMGPLRERETSIGKVHTNRCGHGKTCGRAMRLHHCHPLFENASGQSYTALWFQAVILLMLLAGCGAKAICLLLGANHKVVERMKGKLHVLQKRYVEIAEAEVRFGGSSGWTDVEVDEAVFRNEVYTDTDGKQKKAWEQWAGCVQRGAPQTLVLWKTHSSRTVVRAPGPGAIKKSDWLPFARERLSNRNIILHSDGAKSYRCKVPGMLHDRAIHVAKSVKVGRKRLRLRPVYSQVRTHTLPNGRKLKVKTGTQIIDRAWQFIKKHIGQSHYRVDSRAMTATIRSAQWSYWHRHQDQWNAVGELVDWDFRKSFV